MKKLCITVSFCVLLTAGQVIGSEAPPAPNGLELPQGYKEWQVLGASHREDNKTLRVILGNDVAIRSARAGKTDPWPDGTILGKLVWKDVQHPAWEQAIVPGDFVHAEFMVKDTAKFPETGGWGFARWLGMDQQPYGKDASFVQECFGCHQPVKDHDYVFTHPAPLP